MLVKIGYEKLVLVDLSQEQLKDVEEIVGITGELKEVNMGWSYKAKKDEMFDLICKLSYKYDIEIQ